MDKQALIEKLAIAYRAADTDFAAAQSGDPAHKAFEFSRIIGNLQGEIYNAALELGLREPIRNSA